MDIRLIMFTDKGERREFPLVKPRVLVGRTVEADLRIPLSVVSRRQCEIHRDGDDVVLRDLGSSNGTLVNGVRVKEIRLSAGDQVAVGPVTFVVVVDGQPGDVKPPTVNGRSESDRLLPAIIDEEDAGAFDTEPTVFQDKKESARADRARASIEGDSESAGIAASRPSNGSSSDGPDDGINIFADESRGDDEQEPDPIDALEALARQIKRGESTQSKSDA